LQELCSISIDNGLPVLTHPVSQILRLQAVEFLIAPYQVGGPECRLLSSYESYQSGPHVFVHQLKNPLSRAFVVGDRILASETSQIVPMVLSPNFDPSRTVILEEPSPVGEPEARGSFITWERDDPQEIILKVQMKGNGYLVLSDTFYPGWNATVDGQPARILKANSNFRALWLTKGEHGVDFVYEPRSFRLGLMVSLVAWIIFLGGVFWRRKN